MWRLVRNATEGQEAGEKDSLGDVAKNATEAVARDLAEEMWRLVEGGGLNETAELDVNDAYNSSGHNNNSGGSLFGSLGTEIGM